MEQVSVPLPFTKEAILSLNNGTVTFEEARALFNVDLSTFKARLEQLNIFVWKVAKTRVRIHVSDYDITIIIKDMRYYTVQPDMRIYYTVRPTDSLEDVIRMIEEDLKLSPGCYKLTYKHPNKSIGNVWVKTDRDWHFAVLRSKRRGYFVFLSLEAFPSSQTADENAHDEDACDEDACDQDACDKNSMEQVSVPLPLTKEAILSLNNGTVTFEQARALFNVDLSTFKAKLEQFNIFVWNEAKGARVRIHVDDYEITIIIKNMRKYYTLQPSYSFEDIILMLEKNLKLSPGCYKLTYKHPKKSIGNVWVKTDRDWHYLLLFARLRGYIVHLNLEVFPFGQIADEDVCNGDAWIEDAFNDDACDEDAFDYDAWDEDSWDEDSWDEDTCDEDASDEDAYHNAEARLN